MASVTTYYLLPTTYYLLPTTYYLLPTTYYLLPTTYYLLPTTCYLLPTTYYLLPTTYHLLPTTYYLLPSTSSFNERRRLQLGSWPSLLGRVPPLGLISSVRWKRLLKAFLTVAPFVREPCLGRPTGRLFLTQDDSICLGTTVRVRVLSSHIFRHFRYGTVVE